MNKEVQQAILAEMDVSIFMSHVNKKGKEVDKRRPTDTKDAEMVLAFKKRLFDSKQSEIKFKDNYTIDWFAKAFDCDKGRIIHKMVVSRTKISKHLQTVS